MPNLTPFERQYIDYKRFQQDKRARRFPVDFYFKKGSVMLKEFQKWRKGLPVDSYDVKKLVTLQSRDADDTVDKDVRNLNRAKSESVYLLVKKDRTDHAWQLPQGHVEGDELLHEVCLFILIAHPNGLITRSPPTSPQHE
jgi:large subunit ribosomal protein L46